MASLLPEMMRKHFAPSAGNSGKGAFRFPVRLAVFLALLAAAVGSYVYALQQWQAAQTAVKEERLDEAQRRLDFCLLVWPRSISVHLLAARTARLRGDFENTEAHLNRCLKLNNGASEAIQLEFLLLRVQGGEIDEVAGELMSLYVENHNSEAPLILETLARAYLQDLRYGPAFACLSRWHEVAPGAAGPFRWRGWVLERLGNLDEAVKEYQQALALEPDLVLVRLRLAEIHLQRRDPLSAAPLLEQLHQQFPQRADVLALLGQCRFLQGEMEDALGLLTTAEQQLPNDSTVLLYLAKLDMQAHPPRLEAAEDRLRRALKQDPTDTNAEYLLLGCLQSRGRKEDADHLRKQYDQDIARMKRVEQTLREDADRPVNDPAALAKVGVLFLPSNERLGRYWLQRALQCDAGYQPALTALAEYYESKGQLDRASAYRRRLSAKKTAASR